MNPEIQEKYEIWEKPARMAWEGLRRNHDFKRMSEGAISFLADRGIPPFDRIDSDEFLRTKTDIWKNSETSLSYWQSFSDTLSDYALENFWSSFGLKFWIPPSFPSEKAGWAIWDDAYVVNPATLSGNTVPAVGCIDTVLQLFKNYKEAFCENKLKSRRLSNGFTLDEFVPDYNFSTDDDFEAGIFKKFKSGEIVNFNIILGDFHPEHQKIVVLDNRRPKEYQMKQIEAYLDDMACVEKKQGKSPVYADIKEFLKLYDLLIEEKLSRTVIVDKMWNITKEKVVARAEKFSPKGADKIISKFENRAHVKMYEDFLRRAEIFTNNRPDHQKRKDSDYTYLDLLRYRENWVE